MDYSEFIKAVKFDEKGLVPVIVQDVDSKKVRMLAYMNEEALGKTLETGKVHYFSRSRQSLWLKGETSSHYQYLKSISVDCDGDTLLVQIEQAGGISCHTGNETCFYRELKMES
ncbi:phosphoribosyl-AMP cyclohydrolase [Cellulosilyticum ruminicola]|uniref:phosphoribosyl-AMP cyclohydrolase n=1 Tax=Cellulosilyticum ruminicola TaxID=425254 RepID=UPI0006CF7D37|nr:phosphoribosyl-AMP cyclohydrolase [Cellulosilyticum ruminicola]